MLTVLDDDMGSLCTSALEKARKAHSKVLQSLADPGRARQIASVLGVHESTVSRTKGALEDAISLIYHLGFKIVPQDCQLVPGEYLQALRTMAKAHMQAPELRWEDD